jgi:CheY-like chemotaxis protein
MQEASNGETALKLAESHSFDIIIMDQYMASVEKSLLGTETVRSLRSKGVTSRICGLSANDVEQAFFDNGATAFMINPFLAPRIGYMTRF